MSRLSPTACVEVIYCAHNNVDISLCYISGRYL